MLLVDSKLRFLYRTLLFVLMHLSIFVHSNGLTYLVRDLKNPTRVGRAEPLRDQCGPRPSRFYI